MTSAIELFVVLGLIYLVECVQWVSPAAVGFSRGWLRCRRWRGREPWRASPRWSRGAVLGGPLPPLRSALISDPLPMAIGPAGVRVSREGRSRFIGWRRLVQLRAAGTVIELGDRPLLRLSTRRLAHELVRSLREAARAKPSRREKMIGALLDRRYDGEIVRDRLVAVDRDTRWIRLSANLLWLGVFGGLPLILFTPLVQYWLQLVIAPLAGWLLTAVCFELGLRRATTLASSAGRELWPDRMHRVLAILSPLSAMRAADLVAREAIGELDPLAVAASLLPRAELAEMGRLVLVDRERELEAVDDRASDPGAQTARWYAEQCRLRAQRLLRRAGIDLQQLLAPPEPESETCVAWCPRCRTQYADPARGVCPNAPCGERELIPFERRS